MYLWSCSSGTVRAGSVWGWPALHTGKECWGRSHQLQHQHRDESSPAACVWCCVRDTQHSPTAQDTPNLVYRNSRHRYTECNCDLSGTTKYKPVKMLYSNQMLLNYIPRKTETYYLFIRNNPTIYLNFQLKSLLSVSNLKILFYIRFT